MKRLGEIKVGKRLSEDEMKQIKAGSFTCWRGKPNSGGPAYFETGSFRVADAWCEAWRGFGYSCVCFHQSDDPSLYILS